MDEMIVRVKGDKEGTHIEVTGIVTLNVLARCAATLIRSGCKMTREFPELLESALNEDPAVLEDESCKLTGLDVAGAKPN